MINFPIQNYEHLTGTFNVFYQTFDKFSWTKNDI